MGGLDQNAFRAGHQSGEILIQFDDADGPGAEDGVDLPVVIEQDGEIVQALFDAIVLPWAAGIGGAEDLQAEAVHVGEDVIGSVVVAEARGPDAPAIDVLAALQPEVRAEVEAIEGIADELPVHQIAGMQDRQARHGVHGGPGEVIVGTDADHVGIGELVVKQGIRIGPVAVVGRP